MIPWLGAAARLLPAARERAVGCHAVLRALAAGVIVGVLAGVTGTCSLLQTPGGMEETRARYEAQVEALRERGDDLAAAAADADERAAGHAARAATLAAELEAARAETERPEVLSTPPVLPPEVVERVPPEVARRLRDWATAFRQVADYAADLERQIALHERRGAALEAALTDQSAATELAQAALAAAREEADAADARVREWQRTRTVRRRVEWGMAAAVLLAVMVAR